MTAGIELVVEDGIATVTIDSPPVNSLTLDRYRGITEAFQAIADMNEVNCVIFTARGTRAFSAGLDLDEFLAQDPSEDGLRQETGRATFDAVRACPVPVIAAVNGPALGAGCVLASLCDIRIASERATFGLPEINVGRCGGAAFLGHLVPQGTVRMMFFTGEPISAHEAHRAGLVERVVSARELLPTARGIAEVIAVKAPLGIRLGKKSLDESEFLPPNEGYLIEQRYSAELVNTKDSREALRAVVEKRTPVFLGR